VCIEIQKNNLKPKDFVRNINEIIDTDPSHSEEIFDLLSKKNPKLLEEIEEELFKLFSE
jgi:radical SAM superfamily enzyme YgiQ (UPF0313 family)